MKKILEFLFNRWKQEVIEQGEETWEQHYPMMPDANKRYIRNYVTYKLTNKFDGSQKIKKVYLN